MNKKLYCEICEREIYGESKVCPVCEGIICASCWHEDPTQPCCVDCYDDYLYEIQSGHEEDDFDPLDCEEEEFWL